MRVSHSTMIQYNVRIVSVRSRACSNGNRANTKQSFLMRSLKLHIVFVCVRLSYECKPYVFMITFYSPWDRCCFFATCHSLYVDLFANSLLFFHFWLPNHRSIFMQLILLATNITHITQRMRYFPLNLCCWLILILISVCGYYIIVNTRFFSSLLQAIDFILTDNINYQLE